MRAWIPSFAIRLLLLPAVAHAEDAMRPADSSTLRVVYAAPLTCPSEDLFVAQVRQRAPDVRVVPAEQASTLAGVEIVAESDASFRARLVMESKLAPRSERIVTGQSCADVVRAVAFIVSTFAFEQTSNVEAANDAKAAAPAPEPGPPPDDRDHLSKGPRKTFWAVLGSLGARDGIGDSFGPSYRLAFERFEEGSWLSPSIRPSVGLATASEYAGGESFDGRLYTLALDGCAFRLGRADGLFGVSPCLRVEGGLEVGQLGAANSGALALAWLAPGALARFRSRFGIGLVVELDAGFVVPLFPHRFYAYSQPAQSNTRLLASSTPVSTEISGSIGWAFW